MLGQLPDAKPQSFAICFVICVLVEIPYSLQIAVNNICQCDSRSWFIENVVVFVVTSLDGWVPGGSSESPASSNQISSQSPGVVL